MALAEKPAEQAAVRHNPEMSRFEVGAGDSVAFLDYYVAGGRIALVHTEVPRELEGRGLGGQLARAGLEYAKREGLKVVPQCSFVRGYIARHPEYEPLVDR